jgi:hypothetical protein
MGHGKVAIETKISSNIQLNELRGLVAFCEDYQPRHAIVVCNVPRKRLITTGKVNIEVLPWEEFLKNLWAGRYHFD